METVNFSRYYLNLQELRSAFKEVLIRIILYSLSGIILYYFTVMPAVNLAKKKHRSKIFESRIRFLQDLLVKIEASKNYLLQYHRYFERRKFAEFWQGLWPFLEACLPQKGWIDSVVWEKRGGNHVLLIRGGVLSKNGDSNEISHKLNELILSLPSSNLSEFIDKIQIEELSWDRTRKIFYYVLSFYPKKF